MNTSKHFALLGIKVEDKVTGFKGIVSSISFDLYGCVQAAVTPPVDKHGETNSGQWFDVPRLTTLTDKPVMAVPDFNDPRLELGNKGAAEKPLR